MKPVSIGDDPTRMKLTYDDFLLFPDDGKRHELIDGEHYVVRVCQRSGDVFARPRELSREAGDVLTTALVPGLELPLGRVFGW